MPTLINLQNISVSADRHTLLHGIDLQIVQGEKIALVGPSGSGKTTLLHYLYNKLGTTVALCPQQLGLVDALSVYHNIYMGQLENHHFLYNLRNLLLPIKKHMQEVAELHKLMQLTPPLNASVAPLSGGERQRVAIARALYSAKPVFLGDEPISHLDPKLQQHVLNLVLEKHNTVIIALHDPLLAHTRFDRLVGLQRGKVLFDSPSSEISLEFLQRFYLDYHD